MQREHKSKWLTVWMLVLLAAGPAQAVRSGRATGSRSGITARAAILVDNQTGEVLWERNADTALPPASTTKVLTAMVALRSGRLEDSFLVSSGAAKEPPSKIHLREGWRLRLLDLIYAILLNSANDASVVIAEGIAGSVPAFAELMNAQAQRLGATNSNFVNPNGLPAADHYSTARDLATLFSVASRDPVFDRIVSTQAIPIIPTEGAVRAINLRTHNRLLNAGLPYEVVGKTGWTIAAKRCFVGAARIDGRELIVAVLGARDLWGDVRKLIEFGFDGRSLPDVEIARVDADEVAVASKAAGDDGDDADEATYSGRASRNLRATRPASGTAAARAQRPAQSTSMAARSSKAKGQATDRRKRRSRQGAVARNAHAQGTRPAKAVQRAARPNKVSQARASAAKSPAAVASSSARKSERKNTVRAVSRTQRQRR